MLSHGSRFAVALLASSCIGSGAASAPPAERASAVGLGPSGAVQLESPEGASSSSAAAGSSPSSALAAPGEALLGLVDAAAALTGAGCADARTIASHLSDATARVGKRCP